MATDTVPRNSETFDVVPDEPRFAALGELLKRALLPIASLKLTVALLSMAIFIVLAGTLAQDKMGLWQVVDQYFRTAIARIEFDVMFPKSLFPDMPRVPGHFYFPGGWLIGAAMSVNLLTAHGLRFKPQARGARLWVGTGVIGLGALATWLVIVGGSNADGFQDEFWIQWSQLWIVFKLLLAGLWLGLLYMFLELVRRGRREPWLIAVSGGVTLVVGGVLFYILLGGSAAQLADPSMRILWQLLQATFAAGVLLAGSIMVFRKRGGIVVIHGGIALMMLSEVLVGTTVDEGVMLIEEGKASNYAESTQKEELAIVDSSDPDHDRVVAVPAKRLSAGKRIADEQLPFQIEVLKHYRNSGIVDATADQENPATHGLGTDVVAIEQPPVPGASKAEKQDVAASYVRLVGKDGAELGTWLFRQFHTPQKVQAGGRTYEIAMRSQRLYKPYWVHLENVERNNYLGTNTPRDYSSYVRLVDPSRKQDRDNIRIWMNNPLRYAGETLYQSGHWAPPQVPVETTGLQIVSNSVWMIPYVGCMIVVVGLGAHFLMTLVRFLNRREAMDIVVASGGGARLADSVRLLNRRE
ncbi:MAG: cytochrome c biogenesis protein ResB, partial [Planctomycetales bacterium]